MIDRKKLFHHPLAHLTLIALPFLLLVYIITSFIIQWNQLDGAAEEMQRIYQKSIRMQEWQKKETSFLSSLKKSDHFYIDTHLETLSFLEPEVKKIENLLIEDPHNELLKKRLLFLREGGNRLLFSEQEICQHLQFQETTEKQQHVVELNEEDLKRTLSLIEGVTIWPYGPKENRPQLIIQEFKLEKKELPTQEHVFVMNLQLIKREILQP